MGTLLVFECIISILILWKMFVSIFLYIPISLIDTVAFHDDDYDRSRGT